MRKFIIFLAVATLAVIAGAPDAAAQQILEPDTIGSDVAAQSISEPDTIEADVAALSVSEADTGGPDVAALSLWNIAADATFDPVNVLQGTGPSQNLGLTFREYDNTVRGRLLYTGANANEGGKFFGFINDAAAYLGFFSNSFIVFRAPGNVEQMRITSAGVRIGTNAAETAVRLTVLGSLDVKGNIAAKYQDLAEWVPSFGDPDAGTVVIVAGEAVNHVTAASKSYDTRIAGVVSAEPGVILGEAGPSKVMVATTGRVRVKADATAAPIAIGDLLVTSERSGYAMKSQPVDLGGVLIHRPGTLVGKALEPLEKGTGEILVLLSIQ